MLVARVRESGYTARVVSGKGKTSPVAAVMALPQGFTLLDETITQARNENKPVVIDFFAEWCAPCMRMEKTTFVDEGVRSLLDRCVFLRIDTDRQPEISRRMNVEGLPDIRFVTPDGKVVKQLRSYQDAESFAEELGRFLPSLAR
ncbi:MAG TPA: thioredoxin domain-containing protein [Blastocatellia bacterium]|nr:thioredoxin domain-containing protein [Blastocatellia bacterium]